MRQSQTYRRGKNKDMTVDPNDYKTYRYGIAYRILRRHRGGIHMEDAWQLAAIPAFFYWLFRGPIGFFKRRKADRMIKRKLNKSNNNPAKGK